MTVVTNIFSTVSDISDRCGVTSGLIKAKLHVLALHLPYHSCAHCISWMHIYLKNEMYSSFLKYLDNDTIFVILPLSTTTMD